jgi:hypothetical protein
MKNKLLLVLFGVLVVILGVIAIYYSSSLEARRQKPPRDGGGGTPTSQLEPLPATLYGVTIDDTSRISNTIEALTRLPKKMTARIVFDRGMSPSDYANAVNQIDSVAYTMAEPVDSSDMKRYSLDAYKNRFSNYLSAFGNQIEIWEIGNEVNGEWLGSASSVSAKIAGAFDIVKAAGKTTALTLHFNEGEDCPTYPINEMYSWVNTYVPDRVKQGVDYVFFSYYPENCPEITPNWESEFEHIGQIFPNAKLGFGEIGVEVGTRAQKENLIRIYYPMIISHPRYVKGIFWWYFKEEMVPYTSYLWGVLNNAISG